MKIGYSCVIDGHHKFVRQGLILVASLIAIGIKPNRVTVNLTPSACKYIALFDALGVRLREIELFGDRQYCNKVAALGQVDRSLDMVVCCDCDLMFVESIEDVIWQYPKKVQGKIVDFANPPLTRLLAIFDMFGWSKPGLTPVDLVKPEMTFSGNYNGGLYVIPAALVAPLHAQWIHCTDMLLSSGAALNLLGPFRKHIDQIGFCAGLKAIDHEPHHLPIELNFPTHVKVDDVRLNQLDPIRVFHYHDTVDLNGVPVLKFPLQPDQDRRFKETLFSLVETELIDLQ